MPLRPPSTWTELPAFRLLGHPIVLGVIGVAFLATMWTLISTIVGDDAPAAEIIFRCLSVLVVGFAAWFAWQMFQARRRSQNR